MSPYDLIPASWGACALWQIPFWALFGNDEDGICGERGGPPGFIGMPATWRNFLRWWVRNPLHNLCFHVIAISFSRATILAGRSLTSPPFWPIGGGVVLAVNGGPLLSFVWPNVVEGYLGWRPHRLGGGWRGVFGIALRRSRPG